MREFTAGNLFFYIKYSLNSLIKKKYFVFSIVVTMGIAIGCLLCFLSLYLLLFLKPLPYPDQDRLYVVSQSFLDGENKKFSGMYAYPEIEYLYKNQDVFQSGAIVQYSQGNVTSLETVPTVNTTYVSPELYGILGANVEIGRLFQSSENVGTYHPVAIISYDCWKRYFGLDGEVVGKSLSISGISFTIVGVLSKSFVEPELFYSGHKTDVWMPWDFNPTDESLRNKWSVLTGDRYYVGKLGPKVVDTDVSRNLTVLLGNKWKNETIENSFFNGLEVEIKLRPMADVILGDSGTYTLLLLLAAVSLVCIAVANVTNLYLSRAAEQQKQIAIHACIGASKSDIFRLMFVEAFLLMFVSTCLSFVVSYVGFWLLKIYFSNFFPRLEEVSFSLNSTVIALSIALLAAYLIARARMSLIRYEKLNGLLKDSSKGYGVQVPKRIRYLVICSQVALTTTLLVVNLGLFSLCLDKIYESIGFCTADRYYLKVTSSSLTPQGKEAVAATLKDYLGGIRNIPGVRMVSQSETPLSFDRVWPLYDRGGAKFAPFMISVDDSYVRLVGQKILVGKDFDVLDLMDNSNRVIINESFAKLLSSDGNVIGMSLMEGEFTYSIIGVVNNVNYLDSPAVTPRIYRPERGEGLNFLIQAEPGARLNRDQFVRVIRSVAPSFSVLEFRSFDELLNEILFFQIVGAAVSLSLILLVIVLSGLGLYGVIGCHIQSRFYELGARSLIGASNKDILILLISDNLKVVGLGVFFALFFLALMVVFAPGNLVMSYGIYWISAIIFISVAIVMLISIFATYLPIRKYLFLPPIALIRAAS